MWQHIRKSHRVTTKVAAAKKRLLAAFKAALVFIPIIVMYIINSLNLISVAVDAAAAASAVGNCDGVCDAVNDGVNASVCERM